MRDKKNLLSIIIVFFLLGVIIMQVRSNKCEVACSEPPKRIKAGQDISIFVAADFHYLSKDLNDFGEAFDRYQMAGDGKLLKYSEEIIDAFTHQVKKEKPDILIVAGDLTNNGEKVNHENLAKKLDIIQNSGTSVFVIPGNHDIKNPWACQFKNNQQEKTDTISAENFKDIYAPFGYSEAISKDENTLSYLTAPSEDLWLLMLDTNQYDNNLKRGNPQTDGLLRQGTLEWIKECSEMAKKEDATVLAVMHHSLLDHNPVKNRGFTLNNNKEAIETFQECGIELVLTGHIHLQSIKSYENDKKKIYDIATGALAVYPNYYGVLEFLPQIGFKYEAKQLDTKDWAQENNIDDENLYNFKKYSRDYFVRRSYYSFYDDLYDIHEYRNKEMDLMSQTLASLNAMYYEGKGNINIEKIQATPGYELLEAIGTDLLQRYAQSIFDVKGIDNTKLKMPFNK